MNQPNVTLHLGDCLEVMAGMEAGSVDAVVTDPPYGCNKAEWDAHFPTRWYLDAKRLARMIAIITGSSGLKDSVAVVGKDFIDVIAARNLNGMTRSPLGFGNWLACVIAGEKPGQTQTFFEFVVKRGVEGHPTQKPLDYMLKLIERITNPDATILDPFMGSGTTGVACMQTGRNFIGIEISEEYYKIAKKRISDARMQLRLGI